VSAFLFCTVYRAALIPLLSAQPLTSTRLLAPEKPHLSKICLGKVRQVRTDISERKNFDMTLDSRRFQWNPAEINICWINVHPASSFLLARLFPQSPHILTTCQFDRGRKHALQIPFPSAWDPSSLNVGPASFSLSPPPPLRPLWVSPPYTTNRDPGCAHDSQQG
jgi:hypothetical protein